MSFPLMEDSVGGVDQFEVPFIVLPDERQLTILGTEDLERAVSVDT